MGADTKNLAQWCQKLLEHMRKLDEVIANKRMTLIGMRVRKEVASSSRSFV